MAEQEHRSSSGQYRAQSWPQLTLHVNKPKYDCEIGRKYKQISPRLHKRLDRYCATLYEGEIDVVALRVGIAD